MTLRPAHAPAVAAALFLATARVAFADSAAAKALLQGAQSGPSWGTVKPLVEQLADRSPLYAPEPGPGILATPKFTTMGGASSLTIGHPEFGVLLTRIQPMAQAAEDAWIGRHVQPGQSRAQAAARYAGLLREAEGELGRSGLRVGSVGAALEYYLKTLYDTLDGAQPISSDQEQALRGLIAFEIAAAESNRNNPTFAIDQQREARYEEFLVEAQSIRDGVASGTRDAFKQQATDDLRRLQIDPEKTTITSIVCTLPAPMSCSELQADAGPLFAKIAEKYPY